MAIVSIDFTVILFHLCRSILHLSKLCSFTSPRGDMADKWARLFFDVGRSLPHVANLIRVNKCSL